MCRWQMKIIIKIRENHISAVANHRLKLTARVTNFMGVRSLA
jgi:hypothetical protein